MKDWATSSGIANKNKVIAEDIKDTTDAMESVDYKVSKKVSKKAKQIKQNSNDKT